MQSEPNNTIRHSSGELDEEGLSVEWVKFEATLGFRPRVSLEGTVKEQRANLETACQARDSKPFFDDLKDVARVNDLSIDVGERAARIPIRVYKPYPSVSLPSGSPVALYYHGGGWILGSVEADDIFCRMICRDLGHVVVSVDYRLAPEHAFPAAVNDCYNALLWVITNKAEFGIDVTKAYVTGNSAGGQLAAAVALKAAEAGVVRLAAQILRIPLTCHPAVFPTLLPPMETVPIFDDAALIQMLDAYVQDKTDQKSPFVSPLLAPSELLQRLPPTYIDVCSADPLGPGGVAYARKLEEHGIPVRLFVLEGMPHGSYILFPDLPSSQAANTACVEGTKWALSHV